MIGKVCNKYKLCTDYLNDFIFRASNIKTVLSYKSNTLALKLI